MASSPIAIYQIRPDAESPLPSPVDALAASTGRQGTKEATTGWAALQAAWRKSEFWGPAPCEAQQISE